jgi:DNA repair protein RadC
LEEDRRLTRSLKDAAHWLDIRLLDHLIVGKNDYFSFLDNLKK